MFTPSHLHPMLVHFPIALIAIGFLSELVYLFLKKEVFLTKMGYSLLIIGTIAACATWLSGDLFTSEMAGAAGDVRETHELFATITIILLIVTSTLRSLSLFLKKENLFIKNFVFVLYALAAISVSITGFFGGTLVYSYMMPL